MRIILSILLLSAALALRAQPAPEPNPRNTAWMGTNSQFIVRVVMKPPAGGVSNYTSGKVIFRSPGANPRGHPARCWRGENGWVTVDYGEGSDPNKIIQFQITGRSANVLTCRTDNTDTILTNVPPEIFTLHRQ